MRIKGGGKIEYDVWADRLSHFHLYQYMYSEVSVTKTEKIKKRYCQVAAH
jgi:hypothetical protein